MSGGYWRTRAAEAEVRHDNYYNDRSIGPNHGHRRSAPREMPYIEWDPDEKRWCQGSKIFPKGSFRSRGYFIRPSDGKRQGWFGRLKDVCSGEGADVFITKSGDKRTLMRGRPQRWQWTGYGMSQQELDQRRRDKDWRLQDEQPIIEHWLSYRRGYKPYYNFRNREFENSQKMWKRPDKVWMDATWRQGARRNDKEPWNVRDISGMWWTQVPDWVRGWPGGRPVWEGR